MEGLIGSQLGFYKTKSAMRVSLMPPQIKVSNSGLASVARDGGLFLEFTTAGNGPREYNWKTFKISFQLNPLELGKILNHLEREYEGELKLVHDTNAGTKDAGQKIKTLSIRREKATRGDGFVYFFNVNEGAKGEKGNFVAAILDENEVRTLQSLMNAAIPIALAWPLATPRPAKED